MPHGVRILDASSNIVVDNSTALGTILGTIAVNNAVNPSGSISDGDLVLGTPFFFLTGGQIGGPTVSISGTTVTWTQSYTANGTLITGYTGVIYYGIF